MTTSETVPWAPEVMTGAGLRDEIGALVALLTDAVDGNASVGFVHPLATGEIEAFWNEVALDVDDGLRSVLVTREGGRIIGTVILAPSTKANQAHRAEVQKLLVMRVARGRGIGHALMDAVEALAARTQRWLLTLDTREDSDAARLYRRRGYVAVGTIPDYACDPDRRLAACIFFYKILDHPTP